MTDQTCYDLPWTTDRHFDDWPLVDEGGVELQFRLLYSGILRAASKNNSRLGDKAKIRNAVHSQLRELWTQNSFLKARGGAMVHTGFGGISKRHIEVIADRWERCGFRFVPLITRDEGLGCALDILFLRRDHPGNFVKSGGDIDNRIKVLLDALRMPQNCDEAPDKQEPEQDPFFCLLEDDSLITDLKITTDRLLAPKSEGEREHDVRLVIHVRTIVVDSLKAANEHYT